MQRIRPYFRYLKAVRGPLFAAIFYGVLYGVSSGASLPALAKYVFPVIFDHLVPQNMVYEVVLAIPFVFAVRAWSSYRNSYFTQFAGLKILETLRIEYFSKLQRLPLSFLQDKSTGDLLSRGLTDTAQLQFTLTIFANDGIKQPLTLISALGYLAWLAYSTHGVGIVLACFLILPLTIFPIRYVGRKVLKRAQQVQAQLGDITGFFSENLSAAREVRAFGLEDREITRFSGQTNSLVRFQMKIVKYAQALTPAIELLSAFGISVTLALAYGTDIDLSTFMSIVFALYMCYEPIKKLGFINNELKRAVACMERLEVVLDAPVTIRDPETPAKVGRLAGHVAFQNVTFAYKQGEPVLTDVSAQIPAGTVCALVGPSGAGKSTFANLVPRFYETVAGRVTIDGIDVRDMRLADLRRNIALVSQDPVLFNDTIFNNLLLGRPEATRAEVEQAARDAFAHDFILAQPKGYDTLVGERGASLSGGQKQRVALARAFLRNAPILILDEATSALDTESEAAIQAALKKLVQGKTVLIIAHRFSTIRDASLIQVFDQGRIVGTGSHAELYESCNLYKRLYDGQTALG
ncbi:lipid A export ATP-binding/permease protein MsbA [mine drainage metagenome]|uniref:Lipid A export ATP-binding/permease protein MsbA n=1 Tax=mine drainage metagenome TaxID=410659 RepID=A0A1J5S6L1_9ZZZZ